MKRLSRKQLWSEGFKQGYKKALKESHSLNEFMDPFATDPALQDVEETIVAAVEEAGEEGVTDIHGIIDYWQQLYADDVLYGDEPLGLDELTDVVCRGFEQAGIEVDCQEIADLLQSYADLRDDFESRF